MQILFGRWKGRRLRTPADESIRPTTSRMRDWVCNVLRDRMEGARVLDLFAGCGTLGLDALSLGAASVTFVEQAPRARKLLLANLALLPGAEELTQVLPLDVYRFLKRGPGERWDLIFVDPPYAQTEYLELVSQLHEADILEQGGLLVVEHPSPARLEDGPFRLARSKAFGRSTISLLEHS